MMIRRSLLALPFLLVSTVSAQPMQTLDTVVVTATRSEQPSFTLPGIVNKVDATAPEHAGATTAEDLLIDLPGVEFAGSARRNGQVPSLRGYDGSGVLVLFDGVRQNFQSVHDGQFFIDPSLLKSVEVVKGPSSTLYGSGALGGVIAFETVSASDLLAPGETQGAIVRTGFQSVNDEFFTSGSAYGRAGDFDLLASLTYRNSDDIRLGNGQDLAADDDIRTGLVKVDYTGLDNHHIGVSLQHYDAEAIEPNNPQTGITGPTSADEVDKDIVSTTAKLSYDFMPLSFPEFQVKTQWYYTNTELDELIVDPTATNQPGDVLTRELDTIGANIDAQYEYTAHEAFDVTTSFGVEAYRDDQNGADSSRGERGGVPDAEADFYGAYLQTEFDFEAPGSMPGTFLVIPGVRYDSYSSDDTNGNSNDENAFSPKIAVTYQPDDRFMVFASYAEAFRAPNLTELYTTGRHFVVGPFVNNFVPNPGLKPETNQTIEFGFGVDEKELFHEKDRLQFKASRFFTQADDFIDAEVTGLNVSGACFSPFPPPNCSAGTTQSVNVPSADIWGYEGSLNYRLAAFRADFGAAYLTGKNDRTGDYLTNISPLTLTSHFAYNIEQVNTTVGIRSTFASEHDNVNDPSEVRDSYDVHDIYASWTPEKLESLTLRAGVQNLFDEAYERVFANSLEPGRNYTVQVSWRW